MGEVRRYINDKETACANTYRRPGGKRTLVGSFHDFES